MQSENAALSFVVSGADARTPVKGEMEGLSVVKTILSAYLHPSRTDDVQKGVLEILSSLLLRYNEEFDGVVLAYFDIKICDGKPKILSGLHPYLCLKLKAKLLLFSPKPGMLLEGTVNKVEKDYIGVIVLGIFNAAIAFSDIREEFSYQDNVNGIPVWVSTSDNRVIRLGSKIKFAIKSVQEESFLDICGSLKLPNTGPLEEESLFLEIERKRHKKEKEGERRENIDADVKDGGMVTEQFPVDYFHEKEHNQKSKGKKKYTDAKAKDGGTVDIEFPLDHFHEEHKHKSNRKPNDTEAKVQASGTIRNESKSKRNNADAEAKDSDTVGKEFPADHDHEDHKHKSKRKVKQNDADAEVKDGGTVRNKLPADHVHKREHKHKSKRKENDADPEVKDSLAIRKELPADRVHEREHKHKSKRKRNDKDADV